MTTTVKITNNGPNKVRVRLRNISKSARTHDSDQSETMLAPGESVDHVALYDTRKVILEEEL